MKSSKEGVIINDFDGVYNLNSTPAYLHVINSVLNESGISLDPEVVKARVMNLWGMPPRLILNTMLDHDSRTRSNPLVKRSAASWYKQYMKSDFPNMIIPVEGAPEALEELSERYDLALNTACDREVVLDVVMPKLGIDPKLFNDKLVWTAEEIPANKEKPDPYVIEQILRMSDYQPNQAVMVGDSQADVMSAYFAGVEPVVPLTGNLNQDEAKMMDVRYVIEDVTELPRLLPRIMGRLSIVGALQ